MTFRSYITVEMKYQIFLSKVILIIIVCFIILLIRPQISTMDEI